LNIDIDDDDDDDYDDDAALELVDEDMMRCQIINCVAALQLVQRRRGREKNNSKYELTKRKVFSAAISMILDTEVGGDQRDMSTIFSAFPDVSKKSDERSWLMMHFAIALNARNRISEDEVHTLLSADPLAMQRSSNKVDSDNGDDEDDEHEKPLSGCTPAHILCMQKQPKMSLVRYLSLRDPRSFALCDQSGRCGLHLVAQYSESLELLQSILQVDCKITKMICLDEITPLGLLCRRSEFPTLDKMVACLIEVDTSVEVIKDGIV
jgi:hypothetical protein